MEKIKNILSHNHRKSVDKNVEPSVARPAEAAHSQKDVEHPIYDQMAKHSPTSAQPSASDDAPHHFSTGHRSPKTDSGSGPAAAQQAQTNVQPERAHHMGYEVSSASIKSGVVGYPPSPLDTHAALKNDDHAEQSLGGSQIIGGGNDHAPAARKENLTTDPAGSGVAPLTRTSTTHNHDGRTMNRSQDVSLDRNDKIKSTSLDKSPPAAGTDRAFPLTGGVVTEPSPDTKSTSAREPGLEEWREAGPHDSHGRKELAGAAAAATAASAIPSSHREDTTSEQPSGSLSKQIKSDGHPEALAADSGVSSAQSGEPAHSDASTSGDRGDGSNSLSNQLLFTKGPHPTDAGNMFDPNLSTPVMHVPGEFPSPTPIEEPLEPSYITSKAIPSSTTAPGTQQELRHTGTLDSPQNKQVEQSPKTSSPDRDSTGDKAVGAAGLGAGAGAYVAGKHHQESPQAGKETFASAPSPYSSTKIDPRVDSTPRSPTSTHHQSKIPRATGSTAQRTTDSRNQKPEHNYGRDAALVGAGAGTTAGLHAVQRSNQPDSGPASATIGPHESNVANVLDPRVKPDPAYQKHHETIPKQEHHNGRNAAAVGLGGAGVGAGVYEAADSYDNHGLTQPAAQMNEQRYDPTASTAKAHSPISGTVHNKENLDKPQHHYGHDAAIAGGLGAAGAGAGAYAATRGNDHTEQQPLAPRQQAPSSLENANREPAHQRYDSVQDPTKQSQHDKRNLVAGTAAGAAIAGGGAYAYSQQHDADMKAREQQLQDQQKAFNAQQKAQDKALHDQEKQLKKDQAKDQKLQNKQVAFAGQQYQNENPAAAAHGGEEQKEKKHRFSFLHRDKDRSAESSPRSSVDGSRRRSKEYAATGAGPTAYAAAQYPDSDSNSEGKRDRHRLHKDPPPGHPAREAMDHQQYQPAGDGRVIEPHTGLPMNIAKYGTDGSGGTDGSNTVRGFNEHDHSHLPSSATAPPNVTSSGARATDWESIKKGDTVY